MCRRISLNADTGTVSEWFHIDEVLTDCHTGDSRKPTEPLTVIAAPHGKRVLKECSWGIFPFWAKDSINAHSETVRQNRAYKQIFARQRCIVPCDSFYVEGSSRKKEPSVQVTVKGRPLLALAGLYDIWVSPGGAAYHTCSILTTWSNEAVAAYQERMPVILEEAYLDRWLSPHFRDDDALSAMMKPIAPDELVFQDPDGGREEWIPGEFGPEWEPNPYGLYWR